MFDSLWVEKYRPSILDDLVLSEYNRKYFESLRKNQECPNLMLSGCPGIGKSTLAKILVNDILDCQELYINASEESGIDTIRSKVVGFSQTKSFDGKIKVVILDEVDGLSSVTGGTGRSSAQQALRNVMEEYAGNTRFILTCNYRYKVIPALHSRCQEFDLTPPFDDVVKRCVKILKAEGVKVENGDKKLLFDLIKSKYPDLRKIINVLQKSVINGKLYLVDNINNLEFAEDIFNKVVNKKDINNIREFYIQHEVQFGNDYHQLMKDFFEVVYSSGLEFNKKRALMLCISTAMYQHQIVMDAEINFYTCLLAISEEIG